LVFALPYYTVYYTSLNMVAGQSIHRSLAELRLKLLPTWAATSAFWLPVQSLNFRLVAPAHRVPFLAAATYLEFNILAVFKRWNGSGEPQQTSKEPRVIQRVDD